jgi:hypothetical protein
MRYNFKYLSILMPTSRRLEMIVECPTLVHLASQKRIVVNHPQNWNPGQPIAVPYSKQSEKFLLNNKI